MTPQEGMLIPEGVGRVSGEERVDSGVFTQRRWGGRGSLRTHVEVWMAW